MQYMLTNLNAFLAIIGIGFSLYLYFTNISENNNLSEKNNSPIQLINQLKGYFSINPILALCLVITMFSFIGLPPMVGFFGKQMVLITALDNNKTVLVIVAVLTSVIGAVYYLTVIKNIYFDKSDYEKSYIYVEISLSNYLSITLALLSLIVSIFILIPNESLNLCNLLAVISYSDNFIDFACSNPDGSDIGSKPGNCEHVRKIYRIHMQNKIDCTKYGYSTQLNQLKNNMPKWNIMCRFYHTGNNLVLHGEYDGKIPKIFTNVLKEGGPTETLKETHTIGELTNLTEKSLHKSHPAFR